MVLPQEVEIPAAGRDVLPLTAAHAQEMVALTSVAFPGFFRPATHRMGSFFGVRVGGELVAMGGERLLLPRHPEMSAICTHPDHRGEGLATDVICHLAKHHRRAALISWLHVGAPNRRAIELYTGLGFERVRSLMLHRITRSS
jgi:ribosomal protein S18 acetylase RimI-like enzyme